MPHNTANRLVPPRRLRGSRKPARLSIEALEDRLMLDGAADSLPATIVVGRTLSSYTVGGIQNNQATITYTVYNEQADPESGVLLTTALAPGVVFAGASVQPDRNGQDLAWNLGTLEGFGRATVTVTVSLPANVPPELDTGAHAFATLNGRAVSDDAPAAALRPGTVDPSLLSATVDADANDPFVQEKAAELDYDPQKIFAFLRDDVGYESYSGSLRGARGTLWSGAGNALDEASLGVALYRASGIPARYAQGTLSDSLSSQLILSMFPDVFQRAGALAPGTAVSDLANDPQLLAGARNHYWIEVQLGPTFVDADPAFPGAVLGQTFAPLNTIFNEVADADRYKVRIRLDAETTNLATGLFGVPGQSTSTVLDETFPAAELVGRPLTIGNHVSSTGVGALFSLVTNTFSPYLMLGDSAFDQSHDLYYAGQDYQEVLTNFPFGSQVLTGLFLNVDLTAPGQAPESYEHTILDRIGFDVRQNGGTPNLALDPTGQPAVSDFDLTTLNVLPSTLDPAALALEGSRLEAINARRVALAQQMAGASGDALASLQQQAKTLGTQYMIGVERVEADYYAAVSDMVARQHAASSLVKAYFDSPRITIVSNHLAPGAAPDTLVTQHSIDLRKDDIRAIAYPGQGGAAALGFATARGFSDNIIEANALTVISGPDFNDGSPVNTIAVFEAAQAQGIEIAVLTSNDLAEVASLAISAEAKARISATLMAGRFVFVPRSAVQIDGKTTVGWYDYNPETGEVIGVMQDGNHGVADDGPSRLISYQAQLELRRDAAFLNGILAGQIVIFSVKIAVLVAKYRYGLREPSTLLQLAAFSPVVFQIIDKAKADLAAAVLPVSEFDRFKAGFEVAIAAGLNVFKADPPVPTDSYLDPGISAVTLPNIQAVNVHQDANRSVGGVSATLQVPSLQAAGTLAASWSTAASNSFQVQALNASQAVVRNANGVVVGSGAVGLALGSTVAVGVSGSVAYTVNGQGRLSFYGPAEALLGVSGEWNNYAATLSGGATLRLTTGGLTLNGQVLPAGTYTIETSAATLSGSGPTSSPGFAGGASLTVNGGTLTLGPGTGNLALDGAPLDPTNGLTLSGYSGTAVVTAGAGDFDSLSLNGTAAQVLRAFTTPSSIAADQNTAADFQVNVQTSLADDYQVLAQGPEGWTVTVNDSGQVSVRPAPGTPAGTYAVQILVRSLSKPDLVAQATVDVTVGLTQPGLSLSVVPDPQFTVPLNDVQLPTAFQAAVRNLGPVADSYTLTFSNVPAGFTILDSGTSLTVPAGRTGLVGIYLRPNGTIPPPGTQLSFTVTATSTTDPTRTQTQTVTFTVPAIDALSITSNPPSVNTTPGAPVTVTLTVTNTGNVAENNIALSVLTSTGLTVSNLGPVSLQPGQSTTLALTFTPDAATPLNSVLNATVTATFGPAGSPVTQTLRIPVNVVVPGATGVANAAAAANQLGNADLANRLGDLSVALTNLVQTPSNPVFKSQALANLDSVIVQLGIDPAVASLQDDLVAARTALANANTPAEIQAAVAALGSTLDSLGSTLTDLAKHRPELSFIQNNLVAQPQTPATFGIFLRNTGTETTTYLLSLEGLPAGLSGALSQTTVALAPGAFITTLTATLTPDATADFTSLSFIVRATAQGSPEISATTTGLFTARAEFVSVVSVSTDPPFINPGGTVNVSARVLNAVNREQQALASFTLKNSNGQTVSTSSAVPVTLGVLTSLATIDLGAINTAGLALGEYTIAVSLTDSNGQPIPGATGEGRLLVGSPVTSSISVDPNVLPTGTSTVTNTLTVDSNIPLVGPLGVLSQTTVPGAAGVIRNGNVLYVGASDGIRVYDITDPANPQSVRTFGSTADYMKVRGDKLYAVKAGGANGVIVVSIYSLADPQNPALLGATPGIPYANVTDMVVTDTHVYMTIVSLFFFLGNHDIFEQTGDILSVDVSDPTAPHLDGVLRDTYGTNNDSNGNMFGINLTGGDGNLWSIVQVDPTTLLVSGSSSIHTDTTTGSGVVHVVDISDPAHMQIVKTLEIPGTLQAIGLELEGTTAVVTGSTGNWNDFGSDLGFLGKVVLATLDVSDPRDPKLIASQTTARNSRGLNPEVSLDNGLFAFTNLGGESDEPQISAVDVTDPHQFVTSATTVPSEVSKLTGQGNFIYTTSPNGLIIYQLDAPDAIPVTARVEIPKNAGVTVVPGSFNIAPTQIIAGANFDTYIWDLSLSAGSESQTVTWQSTVTGMQPGESRPVTLGASVAFTSQGTPGQVTLPALQVSARQILGLDPASQSVQPGQAASFILFVSNPTSAEVTYALAIQGVSPSWSSLPASVTVPAGATLTVPFTLTSEALAALGDYGFAITASAPTGATGSVQGTLTLAGAPVLPDPEAHGVVVSLMPAQATAGQGTRGNYVVRVTNTGSAGETFALAVDLPAGFVSLLGQNSIDVPAGAGNYRDIPLTLIAPSGTAPGAYPFTVTATSAAASTATDNATGTLSVTAFGVAVTLTPPTNTPGGGFAFTVTNTGSVTDTFDLTLAGAGGLTATLGVSQVTLAPGASQVVPITTTNVGFALPGALDLAAVATSRGNAAVKAAATATIAVGATSGLQAQFDVDTKILGGPGASTFLLTVRNLGNTEDSYEAVITGTSGPVSGQLTGPDGLPTLTIPLFRLPALSSGAIVLQADLAAFGQGTVTVRVRSLTNASLSAAATATLKVNATTTPSPTTALLSVTPNPVTAGQPVALTATVRSEPGAGTPTGTVSFFDGPTLLGTAPLDGNGVAALNVATFDPAALSALAGLAAGSHSLSAVYNGDATHAVSTSGPVTLVVTTPPSAAGPTVTSVLRYGYHVQPTVLVITFNAGLDPVRAQDVRNYTIALAGVRGRARAGQSIAIRSAVYDPTTLTVTLYPAARLNVHKVYLLTVRGAAPTGLTGATGQFLDGKGTGTPGTDFQGRITRQSLAGPTTAAGSILAPRTGHPKPTKRISAAAIDALAAAGQLTGKRAHTPISHAAKPRRLGRDRP